MAGQFMRSFSYTIDSADAVFYEDIHGTVHALQNPSNLKTVKKTIWQDDNVPLLSIGDVFVSAGVSAVCTKISVSDQVDAINGADVLRRWKIEYEGVTNIGGTLASEFKAEREVTSEINGAAERTIDGDLAVLLRSGTPIKRTRIVCYGSSSTAPVQPGTSYIGGVCISSSVSIVTVDKAGFKIAEFYKYDIEVLE